MTRPATAILGLCAAAAAFAAVAADAPDGAPQEAPNEAPESASRAPGEVFFTATPAWGASLSFSEPVQQLFRVGAYTPAWKMRASSGGARIAGKDGAARAFAIDMGAAQGENVAAGATRFDGRAEFRRLADGGIEADWTVVPNRSDELPEVMVEARIALGRVAGGFAVDGRRVELPETAAKNPHLFRGKVHDLALIGADGAPWLAVELPEGCEALVQDNRAWGGSVATLRLFFAQKAVEAGRAYRVHAVFRVPGAAGRLESSEQVSIAPGMDWIPVEIAERGENWIEPGSALDLLPSLPHHEPAGKYGRVVAVGDHFELEGRPGEEIRFAGVNLVHGANTPPKDAAENFAANLARFGINSVRLHHHERPLLAKGDPAGIAVDPDAQDRFDALCAACIRHGIYLTTDLYVSRVPVAWRAIGVDRDGTMTKEDFKIACLFHEGAYSNLVEWSRQFLTHVNPYTGRSLAEEPALATLALVNEGNLGNGGRDPLIAIPGVREAWEKWLDGKIAGEAGGTAPGETGWAAIPRDLTRLQHDLYESKTTDKALSEAFALFLADSEAAFARRIGAFVRDELGCNVPVSSISSWYNPAVYSLVREGFDYDDDHGYVDHPFFLGRPWRLPSTHIGANPLLGGDGVPSFAWRRLFGKPFCATEWNWAAPGGYRQASGLVMGALAARQGWSGMWRFAWSHDSMGVEQPGNVRMRYFDLHADPSLCASERAVVTLFRRGDLAPIARGEDAPVVKDADALARGEGAAARMESGGDGNAWEKRVGVKLARTGDAQRGGGGPDAADAERESAPADRAAPLPERGAFVVDTPCTAGGFAAEGALRAGCVAFDTGDTPAAVWATSVDGEPIATASRVLVSHVTDTKNTGATFDDAACRVWVDYGTTPALARRGTAAVELSLAAGGDAPAVWRLSQTGRRIAEIPSQWEEETGTLRFTARTDLDPAAATFFYEIAR